MIVEAKVAGFNGLFESAEFCRDAGVDGGNTLVHRDESTFDDVEALIHSLAQLVHAPVHASKEPPQVVECRIMVSHVRDRF